MNCDDGGDTITPAVTRCLGTYFSAGALNCYHAEIPRLLDMLRLGFVGKFII